MPEKKSQILINLDRKDRQDFKSIVALVGKTMNEVLLDYIKEIIKKGSLIERQ